MIKSTTLSLLLGVFLTACSAPSPRPVPPPAPAPPPEIKNIGPDVEPESPTLAELLKKIEAAYRRGNYELGLSLVKKAYEIKQNDVSTMDRIGSIYYLLGRYGEALAVWTQALPLEHDLQKRRELENSILVTRRGLGLPDVTLIVASSTPHAGAPPAPDKGLSAEMKAAIDALDKNGVKYYASGQYLQATTAFLEVLKLDPGNADATKALKRLKLDQ